MSDKIYICLDAQSDKSAKSLFFTWKGTQLGIKKDGDTEYQFVELKGKDGNDGQNGADGITPYFQIGEVQTLSPGLDAFIVLEGSKAYPVLNFGIPRGRDGVDGEDGRSPVKGIDYFTSQEINDIKRDVQIKVEESIETRLNALMEAEY